VQESFCCFHSFFSRGRTQYKLHNMKSIAIDVAKYLPRKLNCIAYEKSNSSVTDYNQTSRPRQKSSTSVIVDPPSPDEAASKEKMKHFMPLPMQRTTFPPTATSSYSKESIVLVPSTNIGEKEGCALSTRARSVSQLFGKDPIASCEKPETLVSKSCRDVDFVDKKEKKHNKNHRQAIVRCRPKSPHPADVISSQKKQAAIRADKKETQEKQCGQILLANSALESTVAKELRQLIEAMRMEVSNPVYQIVPL
jgi:hypothetical protein